MTDAHGHEGRSGQPTGHLPKATLGVVIVGAAIGLIEPDAWRSLARTHRFEVMIAATTAIGVVPVGVIGALGIAVALSIVDVVRRSATPHYAGLAWVERLGRHADVRLHPRARVVLGVLVYRLWLVFDAEALTRVDATGIAALNQTMDGSG